MPTTNRIIDITEGPVFLRYENQLLVVERKGKDNVTIPINDIGVVVLSTSHVSMTQPAIAELSKAGVCIVFADRNAMPASMCLPFGAHHQPATRFRQQADASKPTLKKLWQEIVRSKLEHQAALLKYIHETDYGLADFPKRVFSGDPDNVEAQGAKLYWSKLFKVPFTRDRDMPGLNALLNYGYTVLRATTARAICATGLHPGLGIHHHHRDNSFCLADDLMEPFRIYVDWAVYRWTDGGTRDTAESLTKVDKENIVRQLCAPIKIEGRRELLFYVVERLASSLVNVFGWEEDSLRLPKPDLG